MQVHKKEAIQHIKQLKCNANTATTFKQLDFLKLDNLISHDQANFMRTYSNNKLPSSFSNMFSTLPNNIMRLREDDYNFFYPNVSYAALHFFPTMQLIHNWNKLPVTLKSNSDLSNFRSELKLNFISKYETVCHARTCFSCGKT